MNNDPLALARNARVVTNAGSVWQGPCASGEQGGVTQGLLQKFLACRYRFKVYALDGWRAAPRFNHKIEYGNMWHFAEATYAKTGDIDITIDTALGYAENLAETYPESRAEIAKWWNVLRVQFPVYVDYYLRLPTAPATSLLQEQVFDVPYKLPSGCVVRLRGKWDGVELVDNGVWLVENKTKGDIDEQAMQKQLTFDLQTMMYLVALRDTMPGNVNYLPQSLKGVRYNVIRRPLSGGKGTIVRHKPTKSNPAGESESEYYNRLKEYIINGPSTYFFRWNVDVSPEDVNRFRNEFLDPCLEFMCQWYEVQTERSLATLTTVPVNCLHFRTPFGLTSEIVDGYGSDLDHFIETGSTVGLLRVNDLFPELR